MNIDKPHDISHRSFLQVSSALGLALVGGALTTAHAQSEGGVAERGQQSGFALDRRDTAVVVIDPQNEVLSEKGRAWGAVGQSVKENKTVENLERLFQAAKQKGFEVFISPHYFCPTDKGWKFNGPLETDEVNAGMFARKGVLNLDGFSRSGADWLERFKPYIEDGKTVVVVPTGYLVLKRMTSFCNCISVV